MLGGMGAGDVKLMAAIGSLFGPRDVLFAAAYTAIAGGVYALILMVMPKKKQGGAVPIWHHGESLLTTGHFAPYPRDESEKTTPLCYGVAIAVGTLIVLVQRML